MAQVRWKRDDHINEQEARALLLAVRHSGRAPGMRGRRVLIFTDSLVVLGAFAKGRSSSWRINRHCLRAAAIALFWGTRFYFRYINTRVNPADGPSRGRRIGALPVKKTTLKGAHRRAR